MNILFSTRTSLKLYFLFYAYAQGERRHIPRIIRNIDAGMFFLRIGKATVDWVKRFTIRSEMRAKLQYSLKIFVPRLHHEIKVHVDNLSGAIVLAVRKLLEPDLNTMVYHLYTL